MSSVKSNNNIVQNQLKTHRFNCCCIVKRFEGIRPRRPIEEENEEEGSQKRQKQQQKKRNDKKKKQEKEETEK